jgi:hypothetical protein
MKLNTLTERYDWQPGNGTRYDLVYGEVGSYFLITWLSKGGSAGPTMLFSDFLHYTYMQEKMEINANDTAGILKFLELKGHDVGYPPEDAGERFTRAHFIQKLA